MRTRVSKSRRGFTLAEVAVTIALVGIVLAWLLQSLSASKLTAAHARDVRLARELALLTLGQIESGLYQDDLENERIEGNYSEEGHPDFAFEAVIGDQTFKPDENDVQAFDNWRHEQSVKDRDKSKKEKDDEQNAEQPYEKIQVKVTFAKVEELDNEYVVEHWVPWTLIHPPTDDKNSKSGDKSSSSGSSTSGSSSGSSAGSKSK